MATIDTPLTRRLATELLEAAGAEVTPAAVEAVIAYMMAPPRESVVERWRIDHTAVRLYGELLERHPTGRQLCQVPRHHASPRLRKTRRGWR